MYLCLFVNKVNYAWKVAVSLPRTAGDMSWEGGADKANGEGAPESSAGGALERPFWGE